MSITGANAEYRIVKSTHLLAGFAFDMAAGSDATMRAARQLHRAEDDAKLMVVAASAKWRAAAVWHVAKAFA